MKALHTTLLLTAAFLFLAPAGSSWATDTDGGNDCSRDINADWGDAPEGVFAYPGVIGKFPTCRDMSVFGTQELAPGCAPRSIPPGPTGHIFHRQSASLDGPNYWLGCYTDASNGTPMGIDSEGEGKMNQPSQGFSFCNHNPTDCVENAFGLTFDQDECFGDGSDAGLLSPPMFQACQLASLNYSTYSCAVGSRSVILNVLIDLNQDGDWNDALLCGTECAYEWAVKNQQIDLPPGCANLQTPPFRIGPKAGPTWLRITLTNDRVTDDFPWEGGAGHQGFIGGETEDYAGRIDQEVPTAPSSWGHVKARYR